MHPYSCSDSRSRANIVYIVLSVAAVASAYGLTQYLDSITKAAWFIEWPSVLGFFALYHKVFDNWLWRWKPIRRALALPDLTGTYSGTAKSSDQQHEPVELSVKIWQTWTSISIQLDAPNSRSDSESASVCMRNPNTWELTYTYTNKPRSNAVDTMSIHQGTTMLTFQLGSTVVSGEYYTGRGRKTHGALEITRNQFSGVW